MRNLISSDTRRIVDRPLSPITIDERQGISLTGNQDGAPLVSIVIPTYNHSAFVEAALESVLSQTYPRLELIVWDDCSSDRTDRITRAYLHTAKRGNFERIEVRANRYNRGAHETLNEAISASTGDYVSILNSDDLYGDDRITKLVSASQATGSGLAFSGVRCIDQAGEPLGPEAEELMPIRAATLRAQVNCPTISFAFLGKQIAVSTGNLLFNRKLFDRIGGFTPLRYCHDWDFVLQCLVYTEPAFVSEPLYAYRIHGNNSFRSLGAVASMETEIVLLRYFKRILYGHVTNELAPSPKNWPGLFEQYLSLFGSNELWKALQRGYSFGGRTVSSA